MTNLRIFFLILFAWSLWFECFAQSNDIHSIPSKKSIPLVTLLVKKYGGMERTLETAILQKNSKTLQSLLSPDFEARKGNDPNTPIPRDEWIQTNLNQANGKPKTLQQIAVRELGDVFIVSFLQISQGAANSVSSESTFVVDIWKGEGDKSQLMARYFADNQ